MKNNWEKIKLGDVAKAQGGFAFKSDMFGLSGIPIVKIKNIIPPNVHILHDTDFISENNLKILKSIDEFKINYKDVCIAMTGATVGKVGRYLNNVPAYLNQRVARIQIKDKDSANLDFLYYILSSKLMFTTLFNLADGSAQSNLSSSQIENISISLPPLDEQKRIAEILSSFDDKIELLQKQNKTLEDMAKAIFKSWFVDFDIVKAKERKEKKSKILNEYKITEEIYNLFPDSFEDSELGKIPKSWKMGTLDDIAIIKGGFAYKSKNFINEGSPIVKIKNINSDYTVSLQQCDCINDEIANSTLEFQLKDGDIIMAMTGATIGKFGLLINPKNKRAFLNQRVAKISSKDNNNGFVYFSLIINDITTQVINAGAGSAQPNISTKGIGSTRCIIPDNNLIRSYTNITENLINRIILNLKQIQTLSEIRDALLPKLISGAILY